jgi:hypothetical protein
MADFLEGPSSGPSTAAANRGGSRSDVFVFYALLILSTQGFLNYVFRETFLEAWKQILLVILFVMAAVRLSNRLLVLFGITLSAAAILILSSMIQDVPVAQGIYNIFYYISWLPFFVFGITQKIGVRNQTIAIATFLIIILSSIGLTLQLYTSYLDFLNDSPESTEYAARLNEAQRWAFVFVASTIVLPALGGIFKLLCGATRSALLRLSSLVGLTWSAIATGSLGSFIMVGGVMLMAGVRIGNVARAVGVASSLILGLFMISTSDAVIDAQVYRILHNDQYSESNLGRLILWEYAMDLISRYNIEQHLVGSGLGSTNDSRVGAASLFHGESSFFQAYIEGGIIGLMLRLTPFFLLFFGRKGPDYLENAIYGISLFVCCAVAPVFGAYGIQCVLGFIAGLSNRKDLRS